MSRYQSVSPGHLNLPATAPTTASAAGAPPTTDQATDQATDLARHAPSADDRRRYGRPGGGSVLPLLVLLLLFGGGLGGCASSTYEPPASRYVEKVVVKKGERKLELWKDGAVYREYRVALGGNPRGHKVQEGDLRTPEGSYILDWRNPNSSFHKSIHVSYPNDMDRAVARSLGVKPGGMIMIHGRPNWLTSARVAREYDRRDWTNGCIAVTNNEMDEIWALVRDGTPIRILP